MIGELVLAVVLARGGDAPSPPPDRHGAPGHMVLFADPGPETVQARRECAQMLADSPPGSTCRVDRAEWIDVNNPEDYNDSGWQRVRELSRPPAGGGAP